MPFKVEKCTEDDMPRFFELVSLAFKNHHEYIDAVFPAHTTLAGRIAGAERMLATMKTDPNTTFLKVVNDADEMIAGGKWNIYDKFIPAKPELAGDYWPTEDEKDFVRYLFDGYLVPRFKAIEDSKGNLAGAGRLLVKWGTAVADELGVEAVVEAGDYGRGLYEQEGFIVLENYECPVPDKYQERRKQKLWWMKRPAKV
ncbi:hypothetical protein CC80DRAFT_546747 [Byssothecium circinans]|uniref:N-acetyltransferase domain-containing protein n=1 Tax=Byssothecium circinans TaxID=147558 RepID=A0A6A5UBQ5_9PLEO|nr:hypothetical protein CC80DRAFT_546747 [Byssothecium circinans]